MSASFKSTLSQLFDIQLNRTSNQATDTLKEFVESYKDEATYNPEDETVTFGSEDRLFVISHDISFSEDTDSSDEVVFKCECFTFYPKTLVASTKWHRSLKKVITEMLALCGNSKH